mmetsp:Transcript_74965/g.223371  ORF Transcript_74965/g.223371 Transcript_74965/m.223371 type:complete len:223 (+) Transcript_74965:447-1115(+)
MQGTPAPSSAGRRAAGKVRRSLRGLCHRLRGRCHGGARGHRLHGPPRDVGPRWRGGRPAEGCRGLGRARLSRPDRPGFAFGPVGFVVVRLQRRQRRPCRRSPAAHRRRGRRRVARAAAHPARPDTALWPGDLASAQGRTVVESEHRAGGPAGPRDASLASRGALGALPPAPFLHGLLRLQRAGPGRGPRGGALRRGGERGATGPRRKRRRPRARSGGRGGGP